MKDSYDLTTASGRATAAKDISVVLGQLSPGVALALTAMNVFSSLLPKETVKVQAEAAADLIKAGKEHGVKKMKVTMEDQAGLNFDCPVEGVKINASIGKKGKTTIEVEYS